MTTQNFKPLNITLLCKVVDNFGDIGVVYRLARAITDIYSSGEVSPSAQPSGFRLPPPAVDTPATPPENSLLKLRIIADNLNSFHLLCPQVSPEKKVQKVNSWEIFNWNADEECFNAFQKEPPHIIIECFQCGRPDWLEHLLFDVKVPDVVHIIMLDYLTAEDYAESFHKLQSLTRSARVQKVNFMPGFTGKTGGLILDKPFIKSLKTRKLKEFNAVFFSYPRDWSPAVNALKKFNEEQCGGKLNVMLAKGAGFESFKSAYSKSKTPAPFTLTELPFIPQTEWDALLTNTPLIFIRGEDSLSRAALCGVPFVWHAYPQSEEYQLVKVQALLNCLKAHFSVSDYEVLERCWTIYNTTNASNAVLEEALNNFLSRYESLCAGFKEFSESLLQNGDLAQHLIDFALTR